MRKAHLFYSIDQVKRAFFPRLREQQRRAKLTDEARHSEDSKRMWRQLRDKGGTVT